MSTLFAFLHHLAAFTLVAAIAVEFVLLRGELSTSVARRIISRRVRRITFPAAPS